MSDESLREPTPEPATLSTLLARAARSAAGECGVWDVHRHLSWRALRAQAANLAQALRAHGVEPGARVAFYLEPSVEQAVVLFGTAGAGAVAVPINPKLRDGQVAHVLQHSGARVVVTSRDKLAFLADPAAVFAGCTRVVAGSGGADDLAAWTQPHRDAARLARTDVEPTAPAVLLYTSGSTGLPKGIVQDHRNLVDGARIVSAYLGLGSDDRILGVLPVSFDYGLNQLLDAAWLGCDVGLVTYFTRNDLVDAVERHAATVLAGVPPMWAALGDGLRTGKVDARRLRTLRVVTNSGGRLHRREIATLRQALPDVQVFSMYGLTEAFRSSFLPPDELDRRPDSIGKAIPEVELLVVDPTTGAECGPDEVGELVHAGALVAQGYWRDPAATARRFRPHPLDPRRGTAVFSGDLVRRDADGFLYFVARADAQLKVAGHRVAPDEIEVVLNAVPGVAQAVVVGLEDETRSDTRVIACVQAAGAEAELEARVQAACKRALPAYMVPAEVRLVGGIPTGANGKPDREALRRQLAEERR
ncbi:MAG: AMP-binding protein [Planctomycetota bacterium]